jgi:membrane-associated phospholipid phosphatase
MNPLIYNLSVNSPNIINITSLFIGLILEDPIGLYFLCIHFINSLINPIIKYTVKQSRPRGAKNCASYVTYFTKSHSYGMPSGHSQNMGLVFGFWICYIWTNRHKSSILKVIGALFIIISSLYIPYSRVIVGCHSVSQVIIGFIIGLIVGVYSYRLYETKFKEKFKEIKKSL